MSRIGAKPPRFRRGPAIKSLPIVALVLVAFMLAAADEARADELLLNGGFEQGTEGWTASHGELTTTNTAVHTGNQAAMFSGISIQVLEVHQWIGVASEESYEFDGWVRVDSQESIPSDVVFLRIMWFNQAGSLINSDNSPWLTKLTTGYERLSTGSRGSPLGAAWARVGVYTRWSSAFTIYLDDFSFTGAKPPPATASPSPQPPTPTTPPPSSPTPATSTPLPSATPAQPGEPNVFERLTNGGFEQLRPDGTPYGWRDVGAELSVTAESSVEGRFALAVTSRTGSTKWVHQSVRVEPGAWYEASAYARSVDAAEVFVRLSWYTSLDGSGAALDSVDSTGTAGPGAAAFTRLTTGPVRAPANALVARLRLMLRPGSDAETVALFDAVSLEAAQPDDMGPDRSAGAATTSSGRPHSVISGATSPQPVSAGVVAAVATPFVFANVHPGSAQVAAIAPSSSGGYEWLAGVGVAIGGAALVFALTTEVAARRRSE